MSDSFLALSLVSMASAPNAEEFDNNAVVALAKSRLGDEVILAKIVSAPCSFDLATYRLIELKDAGVSSRVIAAMVDAALDQRRHRARSTMNQTPQL